MHIELTDDAAALLSKRGGTLVIDLIRPTGWGKVAEVAVATQTKGRNLAPYVRLRRDDLEVLVAEDLVPLAPRLRISTRRWVTKGFHVDFPEAPACDR